MAVGWVDVTGVSSRSSITSSNVTQLGNVCGSAADYCLVTDSKDIQGTTWFNNSTSASNYANTSLGGSSSAPMVSGIVALLQQAFSNHTNEAIVDRILASAKNLIGLPLLEKQHLQHMVHQLSMDIIRHGGMDFQMLMQRYLQLLQVAIHYHLAVEVEVEAGLVEVGLEVGDQYLFQH